MCESATKVTVADNVVVPLNLCVFMFVFRQSYMYSHVVCNVSSFSLLLF